MAEIFDFIVNDNRTITYKLTEPIMLEDNGVSDWRFHIPNIVNGLDATGWQWWLVYVNAKNEKYTIPLTLEYDYDRPDAYSIATYTVDYGMSCKVGGIKFSIEAIDTDAGATILHEWHTKTYSATVEDTLQGNQVEYAETESDIISALLIEVRNKVNQLVGGATPLPVNLKSLMTDHDKVYLYTGSEPNESTGYWYHWNGTQFVPGGLYGAGIIDAIPTQGSTNAVSSGGVYDEISDLKEDLNLIPKESESDAENVDLDISDRFGNVLVRMAGGHVQTKNFDSTEVYGVNGTQTELSLASYPVANGNFEEGATWTGGAYKGVFVPRSDLGDKVKFEAISNKIVFAFMKTNVYASGQYPDVCSGTTIGRIRAGGTVIKDVPTDCNYLYVYLSKYQAFIGTIKVTAITDSTKIKSEIASLQAQIDAIKAQTGLCYLADTDQILRTLKHSHSNCNDSFTSYTSNDNLAVIAHISDIHNDPTVYGHFIGLLNDNVGVIDCGIATGDIVDQSNSTNIAEMLTEEENLKTGTELLKVIGNHDRGTWTLSGLYDAFGFNTDTEELYYVKDFPDKKIRIIVLNQYDTESGQRGLTGHYSQDQLDWFCTQLQGAITNGYHVLIAYHSCSEVGLPVWNSKGFCQDVYSAFLESASGEHIIEDIVNAFQTGGSLQKSITYSDTEVTVSVDVTFSAKGVFVAYLCGHAHYDRIGQSPIYPNQLTCIIQGAVVTSSVRSEATAKWQSHYDTPRVAGTSTEDSFNVYAIDTTARLLKVAKIGSTLTDKFVPRSFATFAY